VLPPWALEATRGFLEGFLSSKIEDVDSCMLGALGPIGDIRDGFSDVKKGIKDRNLTEVEEGIASFRKVMQGMPAAMQQCKAMKPDVMAIRQVLKGFHGLQDIIAHIKSDLEASEGDIARDFELMKRSFGEHKYYHFGRYLGQMLHRLVIGPEGALLEFGSSCTGDKDPSGTYPMCYHGSYSTLGLTQDSMVKILSYESGKGGTMNLDASGMQNITCHNEAFTKIGQDISSDLSSCLPSLMTVQSVKYCSDTDTISVTVKSSLFPIPVSASLSKIACPTAEIVV